MTECSTTSVTGAVVDLQSAVSTLAIAGQNAEKDRATLQGKLSAALAKIDEGKPLDAAAKLADFSDRIVRLRDAGRISSTDAAALTAAVAPIIGCLSATEEAPAAAA